MGLCENNLNPNVHSSNVLSVMSDADSSVSRRIIETYIIRARTVSCIAMCVLTYDFLVYVCIYYDHELYYIYERSGFAKLWHTNSQQNKIIKPTRTSFTVFPVAFELRVRCVWLLVYTVSTVFFGRKPHKHVPSLSKTLLFLTEDVGPLSVSGRVAHQRHRRRDVDGEMG